MKQREIKFRAWNKSTELMNNYVEIYCYKDGSFGCSAGEDNNNPIGNTDNFILMQYTGLKDKNGKDIYEGDVLEMDDSESTKGVVVFDEGSFRLKEKSIYYSHLSAWKTDIMSTVLGNIYEHPGLLA